jgi:hypothetical protein
MSEMHGSYSEYEVEMWRRKVESAESTAAQYGGIGYGPHPGDEVAAASVGTPDEQAVVEARAAVQRSFDRR